MGPGAQIPGQSSTDHGSIIVLLFTSKFYLLRTASCAANLLSEFNRNIASVHMQLLTAACSAGKLCFSSWRAALLKSVVLT